MTICDAPGCTDEPKYAEPAKRSNNVFHLCKRHVDPTKDGITRLG